MILDKVDKVLQERKNSLSTNDAGIIDTSRRGK
jgi:hypothetical protein